MLKNTDQQNSEYGHFSRSLKCLNVYDDRKAKNFIKTTLIFE